MPEPDAHRDYRGGTWGDDTIGSLSRSRWWAKQVARAFGLCFIIAGFLVMAVVGYAMAGTPTDAFAADEFLATQWILVGLMSAVLGTGLVVVGLLLRPRPDPGVPPVPRETAGGSGRTDAAAKQRARESIAGEGHRDHPIFPPTRNRPWTRNLPAGGSDPGPPGPSRG